MKKRYKLTISYDGSGYSGWQVQPKTLTIQEMIQKALATVLKKRVHVTGSGRTDAKAHALGQVAHIDLDTDIEPSYLQYCLNNLLPKDIRLISIEEVSDKFHARYSAKAKIYHYHLHLDPVTSPFTVKYRYVVRKKINLELLNESKKLFLGTHNFQSFANKQNQGAAKNRPVKTIYRIDIKEEPHGVRLEFEGDGFLYKMVRNIVGTMLDIGASKLSIDDAKKILEAKDRKMAGRAAPANALFLAKVLYDNPSTDI